MVAQAATDKDIETSYGFTEDYARFGSMWSIALIGNDGV